MTGYTFRRDGGSAACAKCGVTAMEIDMLELP